MPTATPQQLFDLAQTHLRAGQSQLAETTLRQVVDADPRHPRAAFFLGVLTSQTKRAEEAARFFESAAAADPAFAEPHFMTGLLRHQSNHPAEAIAAYRRALAISPEHPKALNNLGRLLLDCGQTAEALSTLVAAVRVGAQNPGAISNLGDALRQSGQLQTAIDAYRRAVAVKPDFAHGYNNLGSALAEAGDTPAALTNLRRAVDLDPRLASARYNLARLLQDANQFDEALVHATAAVQLQPTFADALNVLGNLQGITGDVPAAILSQSAAVEAAPARHALRSNLLLSLHYLPMAEPLEVFKAHRQFDRQVARPPRDRRFRNAPNPDRRLRVGYVSPNFNAHSVAYFFLPVLQARDPGGAEVFCYADGRRPDAMTAKIRAAADHFVDVTGKPDAAVAEKIEADGIDVLVDLAGHTAGNRLGVLAVKPAPVQITWLGYPDTTGLSTMDGRVTDAVADPNDDGRHSERLLRVVGGAWAYAPPADAPPVAPSPCAKTGFITFGSFNNLPKITPRVLKTWAQILARVPDSRLVLKAAGLSAEAGRRYVRQHLSELSPDRYDLLPWSKDTAAHLSAYGRVDIALDSFPYNGTTTTCEALWMGVPVVSFVGTNHAGRVGASLLTHAGLNTLLAEDVAGYTRLSTELATDRPRLASVRATLREKFAASPVCDGKRLAGELERAYRRCWQRWVAENP